MQVQQFYDEGLAHASYAVLSGNEIALVDPGRDPRPYYDYAQEKKAKITAVIETHPHADFVSSHLEVHLDTGATIYTSKLTGAEYPHATFDTGDKFKLGSIWLKAINTPGHSPDSISILAEDEDGKDVAVFTGDTLFIGDVGRPDLRENAGNIRSKREELAKQMYRTTRDVFMNLPHEVVVNPAHGAGSLCGKNLSDRLSSTIGEQLRENYALQPLKEVDFVKMLLSDQPFIPKYFGYNVGVNKAGAERLQDSLSRIQRSSFNDETLNGLVIDVRSGELFKQAHYQGAINLPLDGKFETWLGTVVAPGEEYYLIAENQQALEAALYKTAKIGYEAFVKKAFVWEQKEGEVSLALELEDFRKNPDAYTIVDIRNPSETTQKTIFENSILIPLPELRDRANEIPTEKPIVVHCAGGYRSAIGSSIIQKHLNDKTQVYDMGEAVNQFVAEGQMA
jgi:hydroxyacylglutathione hydrolase